MSRKGWRDRLWLDYRSLMEAILRPGQELVRVAYFTALSNNHDSQRRQKTYIRALEARGGLEVIYGKITPRSMSCGACDHRWKRPQEKESDVGMTVQMLADAYARRMDEVWVMSRDTDFRPAVEHLAINLRVKVIIVPPPSGSTTRPTTRSTPSWQNRPAIDHSTSNKSSIAFTNCPTQ